MKKFLLACVCLVALYAVFDYLYYSAGVYIFPEKGEVTVSAKAEGKTIYIKGQGEDRFEPFEIRGVDMGVGIPGYFATDFAIEEEDYLRWFQKIQEMGANTVRIYTIQNEDFYKAFYKYNVENSKPLYLIHGLWVNDYVQNSHMSAFDDKFLKPILQDSKDLVDIVHGNKKVYLGTVDEGTGFFNRDISPWVIGYILGVEWEDVTVAYTDHMNEDKSVYEGKYMYTSPEASPFEAMLAQVGDNIIQYETKRYREQRMVAFSNWPTTDPLEYTQEVKEYFEKIAKVDVEHIKIGEAFQAGSFASYHIYPYYPDYLNYDENKSTYRDASGRVNTYYAYLKKINDHHTIPVIISEFGVPTSRGMAQRDSNTKRNQGKVSEKDQGEALVSCYNDIMAAGCAGSIIFTWQDEWFKRTWNTMAYVDLLKTPYWSDYQTNEQYFGLLAFDPGKEESVAYVDGDISEWTERDKVIKGKDYKLSAKYDEKFVYLLAYKKGFAKDGKLYIPIDTTQKTGAKKCDKYDISFDRNVDFVISIDGKEKSRIVVHERYDALKAMFSQETLGEDVYELPPKKDTAVFNHIYLVLQTATSLQTANAGDLNEAENMEIYETGVLTYGNANPKSEDFNSLADYCFSGDYVEIKLPWQLLNFSNPSEMNIHDDYYEHYGVENIKIDEMYLGIGDRYKPHVELEAIKLKGWGTNPTYHERLKESYYYMKSIWNESADKHNEKKE